MTEPELKPCQHHCKNNPEHKDIVFLCNPCYVSQVIFPIIRDSYLNKTEEAKYE